MPVKTQYIGAAGQLFVMSELAFRGYNVAIPTIDEGDDIFITNPNTGHLIRGQVKTSTGALRRAGNTSGYAGGFRLPIAQVRNANLGQFFYFLVCRCGVSDTRFVVFERAGMRELVDTDQIGTIGQEYIQLNLNFRENGEVWTGVNARARQVGRSVGMDNCFPVIEGR